MKSFFSLLIALSAVATASAGPVITAINNGTWANASTWDLNRVPQSGDTIVIPIGTNISFTNNETLDGVILKIWGALHMSGSSKLDLDDAGLIIVYTSGTITGAGNGDQIKIGNTSVFKGNDPDIAGPAFADNSTGSGFAPLSTLPVTFANFNVSRINDDILVRWTTATEDNNNHFEIERSFNGIDWITIATIAAVGNSNVLNTYSFTDKNMKSSPANYRIRQVDNDGRSRYTVVRSIRSTEKNTGVEIFAGKNKTLTILFEEVKSTASIRIFNLNGQEIMKQSFQRTAYATMRVGNALPGVYIVRIMDEKNQMESKKILLN